MQKRQKFKNEEKKWNKLKRIALTKMLMLLFVVCDIGTVFSLSQSKAHALHWELCATSESAWWSRASENYQCTIVMRRRHRRRHQYNNIHLMITASMCMRAWVWDWDSVCVLFEIMAVTAHNTRRIVMIDMIGRWIYRKYYRWKSK